MKRVVLSSVFAVFGLAVLFGCASMQTWPDYERSVESKMVVIQEKIGEGLKTGALAPDQSQMLLTTLKGISTDYEALRDKRVQQDEWDGIVVRIDALGSEVDRALARTAKVETPRNADRIVALQGVIDDGRTSGRMSQEEEQELQSKLDSIRHDFWRMTEDGRYATQEERADISLRLDLLEKDMNRRR